MPAADQKLERKSLDSDLILLELATDSAPQAIAAARELLLAYGHFVATQSGVTSFCYGALEQEAANLPGSYLDQQGGAILATQNSIPPGIPVGFVAWRTLPRPELGNAWELKRLWATPEFRGYGVGRALLRAVLDRAIAAGKSRVLLDSASETMGPAIRLYRELGFVECEPYNGRSPDGIIYMQKTLGRQLRALKP